MVVSKLLLRQKPRWVFVAISFAVRMPNSRRVVSFDLSLSSYQNPHKNRNNIRHPYTHTHEFEEASFNPVRKK